MVKRRANGPAKFRFDRCQGREEIGIGDVIGNNHDINVAAGGIGPFGGQQSRAREFFHFPLDSTPYGLNRLVPCNRGN